MNVTQCIHSEAFREFATIVLQRVGFPQIQATDAADVLLWASLRGIDTHGVRNLKRYYVDYTVEGKIKTQAEFRVESETLLAARADGDAGLGLAAACWGMRLALEKAGRSGMGFVAMRNSHHLGAAGYYAHMALAHDMIGLSMTGYLFAQGAEFGVLPLFGTTPILGTNPLAIAFPCSEEPPFVFDMATSVSPYNRIELFREMGKAIPLGWGLDAQGRPTTDPAALKHLLPLGGSREQGGHKGFGLAMMVQILAGVLSGAWCENPDPERVLGNNMGGQTGYAQEGAGHFFGALRLDQFGSVAEFKRGMDEMIRTIHASPVEPDQERIYMAGEMEHETELARRQTGIPLFDYTVAEFRSLSDTYDVALELMPGP